MAALEDSVSKIRNLILFSAVAALVLLVHVIPVGQRGARLLSALFDVFHVVGFAALTAVVYIVRRRANGPLRYALIGAPVLVGLVAAGSEGAQLMTRRSPSVDDLLRDVIGISLGLAAAAIWEVCPRFRIPSLFVVAILIALTVEPPLGVATTELLPESTSPSLRFEPFLDRYRVGSVSARASIVDLPGPNRNRALRVETAGRAGREGASVFGFSGDWTRRRQFSLRVSADDLTELELLLVSRPTATTEAGLARIRFAVSPEMSEVVMTIDEIAAVGPRPRAQVGWLNLANVTGVEILSAARTRSVFFVDDVRLD
jgi:hypothetical protein